ncbi:MAG: hypothetical protein U0670_23475 [Anaerolineae bacterium]
MSTKIVSSKSSLPQWIDWIVGAVVAVITFGGIAYAAQSGLFSFSVFTNSDWNWYIVRAAGVTAFLMLAASMAWGVFVSSRLIKDWAPGVVSMMFHATVSWLAVILTLVHMGLLLLNQYYTYTLSNLLIPFTGAYRPFAVGLGIIAFWGIFAVTISFSLRKLMSRKAWLWLHYTSYGAFALTAVHSLLAGTDGTRPAMLVILGAFSALVGGMLIMRIRQSSSKARAEG